MDSQKQIQEVEIIVDGMNAYDILRKYPECPIKLPKARSMTQARIDYYHNQHRISDWYNQLPLTDKKDKE